MKEEGERDREKIEGRGERKEGGTETGGEE